MGEVKLVPMGSLVKVRYAPTVALALPDGRGKKPLMRTAIVAGRTGPGPNGLYLVSVGYFAAGLPGASPPRL